MAKTIKVEWNWEDVATIAYEWMGKPITKAQAEKILARVKRRAEDQIAREGFSVIARLIEGL